MPAILGEMMVSKRQEHSSAGRGANKVSPDVIRARLPLHLLVVALFLIVLF